MRQDARKTNRGYDVDPEADLDYSDRRTSDHHTRVRMKLPFPVAFAICCCIIALHAEAYAQTKTLRILSINVWSGLDYHGAFRFGEYETAQRREHRFDALLAQIRTQHPDVICIQEANPVASFAARLADSLSFDEIHQTCNAGIKFGSLGFPSNFHEGIAILARPSLRLRILDIWKLSGMFGLHGDAISLHTEEANFALVGKIIVNDKPAYLVTVHLHASPPSDTLLLREYEEYRRAAALPAESYEEALEKWKFKSTRREEEVNELLLRMSELPSNVPVIVAGDFNAEPESKAVVMLREQGKFLDAQKAQGNPARHNFTWSFQKNENVAYSASFLDASGDSLDAYERISAIYDRQSRRIDYIFLDKHFSPDDVKSYTVVIDSAVQGIHASDHFGVLSDVDLVSAQKDCDIEYRTVAPLSEATFEPLPIVNYDTDVGFGYGAKAFALNTLGGTESFDLTLYNSTKGERWYRFVFSLPDFELRQQKEYPLALDLLIDYDKYINNNFFGIGNGSRYEDEERYSKEPLELALTASRGFTQSVVAQLGLRYRTVNHSNFDSNSVMRNLPPALNAARVSYASIYASFRYDTRDSYINPSEGAVLQLEANIAPSLAMNDVAFSKLSCAWQYYSRLFYPKTIFAFRVGLTTLIGADLPVQTLLPIGGNWTLRGSPQDRYLDKASALINAEVRFPIYWRFGGIIGFDAGKVWQSLPKFDLARWANNPVLGLRFFMDTFVIRFDVGLGKETTGMYFNFGQLF